MAEAPPAAPRRWRWLALLGLSVLLVGWLVAGNLHVLESTKDAIVPDVASAPAREYVIVLGNKVLDRTPSHELVARLEVGRALYAAGRVRKVFVSGMVRSDYEEPYTMALWLERHGVPREAIVIDAAGRRTAATMANAAALGIRSALIATQGYHLPRSLYLARGAGIDAVGVPAAPSGYYFLTTIRESLARAEIVVEVALRGVRGS
jgi:SanA protein